MSTDPTESCLYSERGEAPTIDTLRGLRSRGVDQRDVTKQKPMGYWLKHADEVITEHVDLVLSDNGFTRLRW